MAVKNAKESGDRYLPFARRMNSDVHHRMTLEQQLERALSDRQFILYYQPKVSIATGWIVGAEGLLRWRDPDGELRSRPTSFPCSNRAG